MAFYEYLHLNGVYFQTNIVPTINTRLEIDNVGLITNGNWPGVICSETDGWWVDTCTFGITGSQYSNHPALGARVGTAEKSPNGSNPPVPIVNGQRYNIVLDKDSFILDNTVYPLGGTFTTTATFPFVIGARTNNMTTYGYLMNGYIGDIRIYENDVLVAEYKGADYNGDYALYDTVSHTYLTKNGTGTIEPGPLATVFEPSQYDFNFGFDGGTQTFTVEAENAWTCTAPTDFTISPMSGNPGTTTVTITAQNRISTVSDTVTFTDSQSNTFYISISQSVGTITPNLTIYQGANTVKKMYYGSGLVYRKMAHSPSLVISGDSFTFPPTSYTSATVVVTTDTSWSYSTEASWLQLTKNGNNLEIVPTSDWDQGSEPRTATVTVTADNGFITKSADITVEQDNSLFNGFYLENTYNGPNTLTVARNGSPMSTDLAYSTDGGDNWTDIHNGGSVTVQAGEKVYLRSSTGLNARNDNSFILSMNESHTAGGDIRTLIDYTDVSNVTVLPEGCFRQLFRQDTALTDASAIDFSGITRTAQDSCQYMFSNCVNLIAGMDMDDVVYVVDSSLSYMYEGCISMVTAPSMSSLVTVEAGGLYQTFRYCTSLQTGVDLRSVTSVTTVSCYYMYQGCSVLDVAYAPSVASWNTSAMSDWLYGVAASGTLYAPSGVSIPTSSSGVPSGWTVQYYGA